MNNGLRGITCKILLLLCLPCLNSNAEDLVSPAATQTYGLQELGDIVGGFAARKPENFYGGFHFTVGVQSNGISRGGSGIVWGIAAEATAQDTANDWLVGGEFLVQSANSNIRWIQGVHIAIGCQTFDMLVNNIPCTGPNNIQSRAIRISSALPGITGWEDGIHLDDRALMSMPGRPRATLINLRDVSDDNLKNICIIATKDKCITIDMLNKLTQ